MRRPPMRVTSMSGQARNGRTKGGMPTRRFLLAQEAAMGAALAFGEGRALAQTGERKERRDLYPQGVASGDPAPDSVILWTRRAPDAGAAAHRLVVEVASDETF